MAMAQLEDFDCAVFDRSVASGETTLPHVLFDHVDTASDTHVVLTAE